MTEMMKAETDTAVVRENEDAELIGLLNGFTLAEKLTIISYLQDALRVRRLLPDVPQSETA